MAMRSRTLSKSTIEKVFKMNSWNRSITHGSGLAFMSGIWIPSAISPPLRLLLTVVLPTVLNPNTVKFGWMDPSTQPWNTTRRTSFTIPNGGGLLFSMHSSHILHGSISSSTSSSFLTLSTLLIQPTRCSQFIGENGLWWRRINATSINQVLKWILQNSIYLLLMKLPKN